ncbi:MAG: hypothetical protein ACE5EP_03875 [Candidatus Methylomirabilales bacterium]
MHEEWTDAEIRGLMERVAIGRRRRELLVLAKRKVPRRLTHKRSLPKEVRPPAAVLAKKKRLAG